MYSFSIVYPKIHTGWTYFELVMRSFKAWALFYFALISLRHQLQYETPFTAFLHLTNDPDLAPSAFRRKRNKSFADEV